MGKSTYAKGGRVVVRVQLRTIGEAYAEDGNFLLFCCVRTN